MTYTPLHTITQLPAAERDAAIDAHRGEIEAGLAKAMGWRRNPIYGYWVENEERGDFICETRDWRPLTDPAQAAMVTEQMKKQGWDYEAQYLRGAREHRFKLKRGDVFVDTCHPVRATAESLACALAFLKTKEGE